MSGIRRRAIHKRLVEERNKAVGSVEFTKGLLAASQEVSRLAILERDAVQAKLDEVMLEYCPDEMTAEQMANWEKNQVVVPRFTQEEIDAVDEAIEQQIQEGRE